MNQFFFLQKSRIADRSSLNRLRNFVLGTGPLSLLIRVDRDLNALSESLRRLKRHPVNGVQDSRTLSAVALGTQECSIAVLA